MDDKIDTRVEHDMGICLTTLDWRSGNSGTLQI